MEVTKRKRRKIVKCYPLFRFWSSSTLSPVVCPWRCLGSRNTWKTDTTQSWWPLHTATTQTNKQTTNVNKQSSENRGWIIVRGYFKPSHSLKNTALWLCVNVSMCECVRVCECVWMCECVCQPTFNMILPHWWRVIIVPINDIILHQNDNLTLPLSLLQTTPTD